MFKAQQPTLTCLANLSVYFIVHIEFIADPTDEAISVNPCCYMFFIASPEVTTVSFTQTGAVHESEGK